MNRIEELHKEVRENKSRLYLLGDAESWGLYTANRTDEGKDQANAEITADIAIRFLEWVRDNGYKYHDPEYGPKGWTTSLFKNGVTTAELFNSVEFQKTI